MSQFDEVLRIRLSTEQLERLREAAQRDGRPVSSMGRRLIVLGLGQLEERARAPTQKGENG
jgi:predicted DNA-binding protein